MHLSVSLSIIATELSERRVCKNSLVLFKEKDLLWGSGSGFGITTEGHINNVFLNQCILPGGE